MIFNITKPIIIYRVCFDKRAISYFVDSLKYGTVMIITLFISMLVRRSIFTEVTILSFIVMAIALTIIFNTIFILVFRKTEEFKYLWGIVIRKVKR